MDWKRLQKASLDIAYLQNYMFYNFYMTETKILEIINTSYNLELKYCDTSLLRHAEHNVLPKAQSTFSNRLQNNDTVHEKVYLGGVTLVLYTDFL